MENNTTNDFYDFLHQKNIKTVAGNKPVQKVKRPMTAEEYIIPPSKPRPRRIVEEQEPPLESQRPVRSVPRPPIREAPPKPQLPQPLNEAYSLINDMKKKMEGIFYRYGMIGLERLDEALEDVIEDIMNPEPVYIEREPEPVIEPPKPKIKRRRRKPIVKKQIEEPIEESENNVRTNTVPENTVSQNEPVEEQEEFVDPLLNDDTPTNSDFANMAANLDLDALNKVMTQEKKMPKRMTKGELDRDAKLRACESEMESLQEKQEQTESQEVPEEDYSNDGIEIVDNESEVINDYEENTEETEEN